MFPEVSFIKTITLTAVTLGTALQTENVNLAEHNALILDTQGSEYQILKGASDMIAKSQVRES
jgi:hypothetical protein